jgi:YD repeat-containing protein
MDRMLGAGGAYDRFIEGGGIVTEVLESAILGGRRESQTPQATATSPATAKTPQTPQETATPVRQGRQIIANPSGWGDSYTGGLNNKGKRHGKGTYTWKDGTTYEGEYDNNKKHGMGTMTFGENKKGGRDDQGTVVKGYWKEGEKVGVFEKTLRDGSKYWQVYDKDGKFVSEHDQQVDALVARNELR